MQPVGERRDDAEIAPAPSERPKQFRMLLTARSEHAAVCRNDLDFQQVVDAPAETASEVAETAAEREAGHSRFGHESERCCESMELGFPVHVANDASGVDPRRAVRRICDDPFHPVHVQGYTA